MLIWIMKWKNLNSPDSKIANISFFNYIAGTFPSYFSLLLFSDVADSFLLSGATAMSFLMLSPARYSCASCSIFFFSAAFVWRW